MSGAIPTEDGLSTGVSVLGDVSYGINQWLAVGFSGGWAAFGMDDATVSGITIPGPDVNGFPLFGEIILRAPIANQSYVPYAVAGFGTVIWNVDDTTTSNGIHVQTDVSTAFAFKLGGGVDWFINDHWIFNINGAYVFSRPDTTVTVSAGSLSASAVSQNDKYDYWTVGGGLKFLF